MKKIFLLLSVQMIGATVFAQSVPVGNDNGQEYVDLGLPSHNLWATANIGATAENPDGDKYQWADINVISDCSSKETINDDKYNATDGKTILEYAHDAVNLEMGGDWHIPTKEDFEELIANTDSELVPGERGTNEGGMYFFSKVDPSNYIFLPASDLAAYGSYYMSWDRDNLLDWHVGHAGWYWSSTVDTNDYTKAYHLVFNDLGESRVYSSTRWGGRLLRGVLEGKEDNTTAIHTINNNSKNKYSYNVLGQIANKGLIIINGKISFKK